MFKNKLKQLVTLKEEEGNNKKKVENIVVFIIILIVTIIAINFILSDKKETTKSENNTSNKRLAITNQNEVSSDNTENTESLSEKLEYILSKISGVGDVNVFINYSQSSEMVAMYNENSKSSSTEETDTSGGIRKIEETDAQKEIVYQENNGEKTPITQKIVKPKIEGAIITAKGASNVSVKTNIIQAVEAATGLATHKIQVFEMK